MKRFYCTICKRIKRVRTLPANVNQTHPDVYERVGQCDKHTAEQQIEGRFHRLPINRKVGA